MVGIFVCIEFSMTFKELTKLFQDVTVISIMSTFIYGIASSHIKPAFSFKNSWHHSGTLSTFCLHSAQLSICMSLLCGLYALTALSFIIYLYILNTFLILLCFYKQLCACIIQTVYSCMYVLMLDFSNLLENFIFQNLHASCTRYCSSNSNFLKFKLNCFSIKCIVFLFT